MNDIKTGEIRITGLADLEKRLLDFSDRLASNILSGAMRAGAVVIQKEARQLAPADAEAHWLGKKGNKSRTLIQPGELKEKAIKVRRVGYKNRDAITYCIYVSKRNWYWKFVEFGHVIVAGKARTRHEKEHNIGHGGYVAARPFMRPAFEAKKAEALEAIKEYLSARIDKEAANGGTRGAAL